MAEARNRAVISFSTTFTLNEVEMRALDALVGYGIDPFLKVFYEKLGEAYMRPHEAGLRSLFKTIGSDVRPALGDVEQAQKDLQQAVLARRIKAEARP